MKCVGTSQLDLKGCYVLEDGRHLVLDWIGPVSTGSRISAVARQLG